MAADLIIQIRLLIRAFRGRAGEIMAELIGQAQTDPALAETLRTGWLQPRREATAAVLQRAIDRSQIRPDIDIPTVMDQLYAPVYWRLHDAPPAARRRPGRRVGARTPWRASAH